MAAVPILVALHGQAYESANRFALVALLLVSGTRWRARYDADRAGTGESAGKRHQIHAGRRTAFTFTLPMEVPPPLETEDAPDISAR